MKHIVEDWRGETVEITAEKVRLEGTLTIPPAARGLVLFAHGSGSSRHSPRNRFVAEYLNSSSLATLLFDLLSVEEEERDAITGELRFNIPFLARRLSHAMEWVATDDRTRSLNLGLFGSSTGAGAALVAAATQHQVRAVVSRGGRPDLAGPALGKVNAATLLIVGGNDDVVIELNEHAASEMNCVVDLKIIPDATHLFEEPGTLEEVARLAVEWFHRYLTPTDF